MKRQATTGYEIIGELNGKKALVVYQNGTPSNSYLFNNIRERLESIESFFGIPHSTDYKIEGKAPAIVTFFPSGLVVRYSGRTRLDAKNNNPLPYIGYKRTKEEE